MTQSSERISTGKGDLPLVAIGASAGGLEPLEQFFDAVSDDPGVAYVVVQHLSPDYRSMMNEILARRSSLPILHIQDGMTVSPNTVYLNKPNEYVELDGDTFHTSPYAPDAGLPHLPIDRFFTSLSSRDWNRTVAIVLSGSGSDGSQGARILHEAGAAVLIQSMQEASFTSMPRAVLMLGSVDRILEAREMPAVIDEIFSRGKKSLGLSQNVDVGEGIKQILKLIEDRHNVDFNNYKSSNVNRRLVRRLHLRGHASLEEYTEFLTENDEVLDELFHDLLIGVTEFYRDPEAVRSLRQNVLDKLASDTQTGTPIKIWVPACASGEEVYTIAIELSEALRAAGSERRFRIIGTDIHASSIALASRGCYSAESLALVPPALRERYFHRQDDHFVVDPVLRQNIIFSLHNLTSDPPFMNLDLVSCRNLLIYLEEEPQASAISMFIFGLLRKGHLFLGAAETVGKFKSAFEVIDARWRIFRKLEHQPRLAQTPRTGRRLHGGPKEPTTARAKIEQTSYQNPIHMFRSREALVHSYDVLLKRYAPSSILMTMDAKVLNWFGEADVCIDTMNNLADWTVQEIVHPDLHFAINVGIEKLRLGHSSSIGRKVMLNLNDQGPKLCQVDIEALSIGSGADLVLARIEFPDEPLTEEAEPASETEILAENSDDKAIMNKRIHSLERDLRLTEETLQHVTERLEASGEELQASNEELQASNEELQASNEELQSSNEELHAVNEELLTVSAEHERKIDMLSELNDHSELVLGFLNTGLIILDEQGTISRFSRLIEKEFDLQQHDIGRSIETVTPRLEFTDLLELIKTVRATAQPQHQSGTHEGQTLAIDVRPIAEGDQDGGLIILFRWGT